MLHPVQEEMSLREQKRLETHARIEDAATKLVDERGFAAVTIEEICEAAGISRRTFFNYFDSKDTAVLGSPGSEFSVQQREQFLNEPADTILALTVRLVKSQFMEHHVSPEIHERRRRIAGDVDAAVASLSRMRAKSNEIVELITQRLRKDPHLRLDTSISETTEAIVISGLIRESVWLSIAAPQSHCTTAIEDNIDECLHTIINYAKGLTW